MKIAANTATSMIDSSSIFSDNDTIEKTMLNSDRLNHITNKDRNAPIGLFDSGIGGLSVYLHLAQQLPTNNHIINLLFFYSVSLFFKESILFS